MYPLDLQLERFRAHLRTRHDEDATRVWDPIRKGYYVLTPEELVRQLLIRFLEQDTHVPTARISVEKQLKLHGRLLRYDLVIHDEVGDPLVLVECKSPDTPLHPRALSQIGRYNRLLTTAYLVITNGLDTFCLHRTDGDSGYTWTEHFPFLKNG